jgi:hypothetical protein
VNDCNKALSYCQRGSDNEKAALFSGKEVWRKCLHPEADSKNKKNWIFLNSKKKLDFFKFQKKNFFIKIKYFYYY